MCVVRCFVRVAACLLASLALIAVLQSGAAAGSVPGTVYVMTNKASGNSVVVFHRAANGLLNRVQEVATGGLGSGGSGDPLGSQGALSLSDDGHFLFAVNAGSNELSVLAVSSSGLQLVSKAASGGKFPISVTMHSNLVYVLNAGTANIMGFLLTANGKLQMLANSARPLAGGTGAGPAEIRFTADGTLLLVTEKNTGLIDIFTLGNSGVPANRTTQTSAGLTPFGFALGAHEVVVVSEAEGSAPSGSTTSSYEITDQNTLQTVSPAVPDTQSAACWVVITNTGAVAFVANSASGTISSYNVATSGALTLAAIAAGKTAPGAVPIDMALSADGSFLYAVSTSDGSLTGFQVVGARLQPITRITGLPLSIQGIAAQ
jgi:6-phosphogluconolactonase